MAGRFISHQRHADKGQFQSDISRLKHGKC